MTVRSQIVEPKTSERSPTLRLVSSRFDKIRKVGAFRHPPIVSGATTAFKRPHALENADVGAMGTGVFIIQELARILLTQSYALVQCVIRKRFQSDCIDGLVFIVERIGLQHVVVAVQVPVF